jgi:hypothetical protein
MRSMPSAAKRFSPTSVSPWLGFAVVAAVYALVATWRLDLPGVYMDEVNPDYLVVKLLNPHHAPIVGWVLRGNYLLGDRVPWLVQLYHGSQAFWLGLPFFALFGTTVEGLRLTHALFAASVLAALYWLLLCARLAPWQAALACAAVALDPSFSYAFRTQSYITLAGDAWLLLAIACLLPSAHGPATARRLFWSGAWAGTAIVGYFVHAFFVPALAAGAWWATRADDARSARRKRLAWLAGCALGASPYIVGYGLLARAAGGIAPAWSFIVGQQAALHAFDSPLGAADRLAYGWKMMVGVVSNAWHHAMMFGEWAEVPGTAAKLALLVGLPGALLAVAAIRRRATFAHVLLSALPVSFAAVALGFGGRLGGHHYVTLLPVFYAALAVGLARLAPIARASTAARRATVAAPLALLVALNVEAQVSEGRTLVATRGVGLMSDAINRFAADINADSRERWYVFPDWGLALPVAFLTRGSVGITPGDDVTQARSRLCTGHDVAVALVEGDRTARRNEWTGRLGWDAPDVVHYTQGDGKVVFDVLGYRGRADGPGCTSAPEAPMGAGSARSD